LDFRPGWSQAFRPKGGGAAPAAAGAAFGACDHGNKVSFRSDGVEIVGTFHCPGNLKPGEKRPALMTTHGFGGSRIDGSMAAICPILSDWSYITLRLDMCGCGESEGERGRIR